MTANPGSHRHTARIACIATTIILGGCATLGLVDNATSLAFSLKHGAQTLRDSPKQELAVRFEPLGQAHEAYTVEIHHSSREVTVDAFGNIDRPSGSYIRVSGLQPGGTNYHERFVFVPKDLKIAKAGTPTEVILRKAGRRIEVVELR